LQQQALAKEKNEMLHRPCALACVLLAVMVMAADSEDDTDDSWLNGAMGEPAADTCFSSWNTILAQSVDISRPHCTTFRQHHLLQFG